MPGIITPTTAGDPRRVLDLPVGLVKTLLEAAKTAVWIADRNGRVLVSNENAREYLGSQSVVEFGQLNVFRDVLKTEPNHVAQKIEASEHEVEVEVLREEKKTRARIQWAAEPGCLIVQIETEASVEPLPDAATQLT